MSVINNVQPGTGSNVHTNQRIAFAGCMGSGKTFAAQKTIKKFGFGKLLSLSAAIKKMVFGNNLFDNRDGYQMIGTIGRAIDPEAWVKFISNQIQLLPPNTNIVIDDIRYQNELIALKAMGFKIVYMDTPWDLRIKRIQTRYKDKQPAFNDFVRWFTHESEVQLRHLPKEVFNTIIQTEEGLNEFISNL